jgi:hypothetical protein
LRQTLSFPLLQTVLFSRIKKMTMRNLPLSKTQVSGLPSEYALLDSGSAASPGFAGVWRSSRHEDPGHRGREATVILSRERLAARAQGIEGAREREAPQSPVFCGTPQKSEANSSITIPKTP